MSVLANYIYILGYLLKHLPSVASLLVLLFLFLKVLLLYFLPLLGFFKALKYLPPKVFTPYSINYAIAWVLFTLISFYTFNSYIPLQHWSS